MASKQFRRSAIVSGPSRRDRRDMRVRSDDVPAADQQATRRRIHAGAAMSFGSRTRFWLRPSREGPSDSVATAEPRRVRPGARLDPAERLLGALAYMLDIVPYPAALARRSSPASVLGNERQDPHRAQLGDEVVRVAAPTYGDKFLQPARQASISNILEMLTDDGGRLGQ